MKFWLPVRDRIVTDPVNELMNYMNNPSTCELILWEDMIPLYNTGIKFHDWQCIFL
jgi:hypothetical protein